MFRLNVETGNAAFDDGKLATELARILRDVADKIENGKDFGSTIDINGNSVGQFTIGRGVGRTGGRKAKPRTEPVA